MVNSDTFIESHVSVPLRGKGRDQPGVRLISQGAVFKFPSPCGEKVGINPTLGKA